MTWKCERLIRIIWVKEGGGVAPILEESCMHGVASSYKRQLEGFILPVEQSFTTLEALKF